MCGRVPTGNPPHSTPRDPWLSKDNTGDPQEHNPRSKDGVKCEQLAGLPVSSDFTGPDKTFVLFFEFSRGSGTGIRNRDLGRYFRIEAFTEEGEMCG